MKNNALSEGKINALKPQKAKNGTLKEWKLDFYCLIFLSNYALYN